MKRNTYLIPVVMALLLVPFPSGRAGEKDAAPSGRFENVTWEKYNPATGNKESELNAAAAEPVAGKEGLYTMTKPRVRVFGKNSNLLMKSDMGEVDRSAGIATLTGEVVTLVTDKENQEEVACKTKGARWDSNAGLVTSESRVIMAAPEMELVGTGMTAVIAKPGEKSKEQPAQVVHTISLTKDVRAELKGKMAQTMAQGGKEVLIRCDGSFVIDRDSSTGSFNQNAIATGSQGMKLIADKLTVIYDPKTKQVTGLHAEGSVGFLQGTQTARGQEMFWNAATNEIVMKGSPARAFDQGNKMVGAVIHIVQEGPPPEK